MSCTIKVVERSGPWRARLANSISGGSNKPQQRGSIRTRPDDRITGSEPLVNKTPVGVIPRVASCYWTGVSRLAYIEHEHRSHTSFINGLLGTEARTPYGIVPDRARTVTRSFPRRIFSMTL